MARHDERCHNQPRGFTPLGALGPGGPYFFMLIFLAVEGWDRKECDPCERFQEQAANVQQALERYAVGHGGKFPPYAMFCARPKVLNDEYNDEYDNEIRAGR